ncbi:hypothetical protein CR513_16654, partial [Mucuna pruriens]
MQQKTMEKRGKLPMQETLSTSPKLKSLQQTQYPFDYVLYPQEDVTYVSSNQVHVLWTSVQRASRANMKELPPTNISLQLADITINHPLSIAKDVVVKTITPTQGSLALKPWQTLNHSRSLLKSGLEKHNQQHKFEIGSFFLAPSSFFVENKLSNNCIKSVVIITITLDL